MVLNLNMSADFSRQQKLASAKKKLRKYQKEKSPDAPPDDKLGKEILRGIQNNHIFKTPPLTVSNNQQATPNGVNSIKHSAPNQKLNFSNSSDTPPATSYFAPRQNSSPVPPLTATTPNGVSNGVINGVTNGHSTPPPQQKVKPSLDFSKPSDNSSAAKVERSSEDLEQSLLSYKRANKQLGDQVNDQRKLILQLQEQIAKGGLSAAQLTEQRALKEQLEVHIQTIGILVSEKSELQTANTNIQKKVATKDSELEEYSNQLKSLQQQCVDFQKNITQLQTSEGQLRQMSKEVIQERDRFSTKLYEVNHEKDELSLENSELHSKLQVKVEECTEFLNQVNTLQGRLQQGELMVQQLSANGIDIKDLTKWNEEKEVLVKKVDEQNEMIKKLVHDKAELMEKHNDTQGHYDIQIEQLKNTLNLLESEKSTLIEKSNSLSEKVDDLQSQLAKMKVAETPEVDRDMKFNIELENTIKEKNMIEQELDVQINENRRLSRLVVEQNTKIEELESSVRTLREDSLDKCSLLDQIQADKETISRALTQNKSLKEQLEELEDGFVKVTNTSADLTDKLASEQNGNKDVATKLSTMQVELEENRLQLNEKTQYCQNLESQIEQFKNITGDLKVKMDSREMDMQLLATELETMRSELRRKEENLRLAQDSTKLVEKLQDELSSAQNTVNQLSYQNIDLNDKLEKLEAIKVMNNNMEGNLYPERENFTGERPSVDMDEEGKRNFEGLDNESVVSDVSDIMGDQEAMMITRTKIEEMERNYHQLQEERDRMLELLEEERNKSISVVESIESHVQLQVSQCVKQKERELNEHFYEQTEALQNKCKSLQDALEIMRKNEDIGDFDMISDGINMQALKTAFMQLQKRYMKAMDQKVQLSERIEHLEHTNIQLENETETIGEYITLYQNQRAALKKKFEEKDQVIHQISSEHSRMQIKVTQLHHLVMQMLSERSGIESKNKQLQELVNRRLAIQNGGATEGSEIPKYDLDNLFGEMALETDDETELIKDNITVHDEFVSDPSLGGDETTQQILQLFEQLETNGEGTQPGWLSPAARKHDFLPCKNCMGPLISL